VAIELNEFTTSCCEALRRPTASRISGKDPLKSFYRVAMSDPVNADAEFIYRNEAARFAGHFTAIVQRTEKHNQNGQF
jgi:hypothetical protein